MFFYSSLLWPASLSALRMRFNSEHNRFFFLPERPSQAVHAFARVLADV